MPRSARLDAPGATHHVMSRGLEGREVFEDEDDRQYLVELTARVIRQDGARCLGWALMPNHLHLLLQSGPSPLSGSMKRILGTYAQRFNRTRRRVGPVFQGRFKSVLVQDEPYFCELVRYIHLNPVRAGLVADLGALAGYPWTGHRELVDGVVDGLCDVDAALTWFGTPGLQTRTDQLATLGSWMAGGLELEAGSDPDAGPPRAGPTADDKFPPAPGIGPVPVLGTAGFEAAALERAEHHLADRARLLATGWDLNAVIDAVCEQVGADPKDVRHGDRSRLCANARAAVVVIASRQLGTPGTELAQVLGVSRPAISQARRRGKAYIERSGLSVRPPAGGEKS